MYDFSIDVIVSEVLTLNLKLFLKSDNLSGDRGDVWFEARSVLGLLEEVLGVVLALVLHSLRVEVLGVSDVVRQCNRGVEGLLLPPERKPSLVQLLGLGLEQGLLCCFSDTEEESGSRGIVVQKALLQPVPISLFLYLNIYLRPCLSFTETSKKKIKGKKRFCFDRSEKVSTEDKKAGSEIARRAWDQMKQSMWDLGREREKRQREKDPFSVLYRSPSLALHSITLFFSFY